MKALFAKSILLASVVLGTIGSAQAVSYDGRWSLTRNNAAGTFYAVMRTHANHFCFLTKVNMEDVDSFGEDATCHVRRNGSVWVLESKLGANSDADVSCEAVCYNN